MNVNGQIKKLEHYHPRVFEGFVARDYPIRGRKKFYSKKKNFAEKRIKIIKKLGQLKDGRAVEPLAALLDYFHDHPGMKEATASQNESILILEALGQIGDKQAITVLKKFKGLGYTKSVLNKILFQLGDSETIDTMRKQEESKRKYEKTKRYWEDRSEIAMLLSRLKISPEKDGEKYKEYLLKYSGEHVHDLYSNVNLERVSDLIAEWCKSEGIPDCKKLQDIPSEFDGYYLHFYWFRYDHHAIVVRFGENSYSFIITIRND